MKGQPLLICNKNITEIPSSSLRTLCLRAWAASFQCLENPWCCWIETQSSSQQYKAWKSWVKTSGVVSFNSLMQLWNLQCPHAAMSLMQLWAICSIASSSDHHVHASQCSIASTDGWSPLHQRVCRHHLQLLHWHWDGSSQCRCSRCWRQRREPARRAGANSNWSGRQRLWGWALGLSLFASTRPLVGDLESF